MICRSSTRFYFLYHTGAGHKESTNATLLCVGRGPLRYVRSVFQFLPISGSGGVPPRVDRFRYAKNVQVGVQARAPLWCPRCRREHRAPKPHSTCRFMHVAPCTTCSLRTATYLLHASNPLTRLAVYPTHKSQLYRISLCRKIFYFH